MYIFYVKVAEVLFEITANYIETRQFFKKFLVEENDKCEKINIGKAEISEFLKQYASFDMKMAERAIVKYKMDRILVNYDAFPVHASALSYKGKAYLFTALSGVGKSTHAGLWKNSFGDDVIMINDDRPYIKIIGDKIYAYSHPQSGKHNIYTNTHSEITAISKIIRDSSNFIKPVSKGMFFPFMVQQTYTMDEIQITSKIISMVKTVLDHVDVFEIHCNTNMNAARIINKQFLEHGMAISDNLFSRHVGHPEL